MTKSLIDKETTGVVSVLNAEQAAISTLREFTLSTNEYQT
jgi:hypothetical protein